MRVLIITGANLQKNESANLSHIAFIKGFCELGCEVTVISKKNQADIVDESLKMPDCVKWFKFETSKLYKYIRKETRNAITHKTEREKKSFFIRIYSKLREMIKGIYGVYGFNQVWINNTVSKFSEDDEFDLMISISTPPESHEAAYRLKRMQKIKCAVFCEIWEDPWQLDIYNQTLNKKLLEVERNVTTYADKILYVSPLTLLYQKRYFPQSAAKMDWVPLASYYESENIIIEGYHYGYFGTYYPKARNLRPFYEAAKLADIDFTICGGPDDLFEPTDKIHIFPRLPLNELKEYEDRTNVLIFVCNLQGGQIPGKIYQYAATNKKILFILDGTFEEKCVLKEYFGQFKRFYFCENNTVDILKTIKFLETDNDPLKSIPLKNFEPVAIASMIIQKCGLYPNIRKEG